MGLPLVFDFCQPLAPRATCFSRATGRCTLGDIAAMIRPLSNDEIRDIVRIVIQTIPGQDFRLAVRFREIPRGSNDDNDDDDDGGGRRLRLCLFSS